MLPAVQLLDFANCGKLVGDKSRLLVKRLPANGVLQRQVVTRQPCRPKTVASHSTPSEIEAGTAPLFAV